MNKWWVVIETGANQQYIFDSNRMRHIVGASQLVLDAGTTWITQASAGRAGVQIVQSISGKAVLLVDDADTGRAIIRAVSRTALTDAPGLDVTGAVGPPFDPDLPYRPHAVGRDVADPRGNHPYNHVTALRETFDAQRRARSAKPSQHVRFRTLPWHLLCRETGLPAAGLDPFGSQSPAPGQPPGETHPASDPLLARSRARQAPRTSKRLSELLGSRAGAPGIVDDLTNEGWIGVVHADGNGVGRLFHRFPELVARAEGTDELGLSTHCEYLSGFAEELGNATERAFRDAVNEAIGEQTVAQRGPAESRAAQILPIVVSGDDVTFVCHADLALPVVKAFLRRFTELTATAPMYIPKLVDAESSPGSAPAPAAAGGRSGLTAAAGIAYVKRHHPFSYAYQLAEELTASAKHGARPADGTDARHSFCTYDLHIAHESTLRPLAELRAASDLASPEGPVATHAGPYAMATPGRPLPPELQRRDEQHLHHLIGFLASGTLSAARAHELRDALSRGLAQYLQQCLVAIAKSRREHRKRDGNLTFPADHAGEAPTGRPTAITELKQLLEVQNPDQAADDGPQSKRFVLLPDAMLLHGVISRPFGDVDPAGSSVAAVTVG